MLVTDLSHFLGLSEDDLKSSLEMRCGFVGAAVCDAAHSHRCRDDHIREFVQQVLAGPADTLAAVQPAHTDERLRDLADLFGELEDPNLQWHVTVVLVQTLDPIPHDASDTGHGPCGPNTGKRPERRNAHLGSDGPAVRRTLS